MSGANDNLFSGFESLTFDDVLVVPGWSDVLPHEVSTSTRLGSMNFRVPLFLSLIHI